MQYISSSEPLYTVFFSQLDTKEREAMMDWCRDNITGQLVVIGGGSGSMTVKGFARPELELDHFGRKNGFAEKSDYTSMMLGFTSQSDLTAFRIMHESTVKA